MWLVGLALVLLTIFAISKHEVYRLQDDLLGESDPLNIPTKKKWHFYKGLYQLIIAALFGIAFGIDLAVVFVTIFTIFQDALINVQVFKKPIDYQGETAWLDRNLRRIFKSNKLIFIFKTLLAAAAIAFAIYKRV